MGKPRAQTPQMPAPGRRLPLHIPPSHSLKPTTTSSTTSPSRRRQLATISFSYRSDRLDLSLPSVLSTSPTDPDRVSLHTHPSASSASSAPVRLTGARRRPPSAGSSAREYLLILARNQWYLEPCGDAFASLKPAPASNGSAHKNDDGDHPPPLPEIHDGSLADAAGAAPDPDPWQAHMRTSPVPPALQSRPVSPTVGLGAASAASGGQKKLGNTLQRRPAGKSTPGGAGVAAPAGGGRRMVTGGKVRTGAKAAKAVSGMVVEDEEDEEEDEVEDEEEEEEEEEVEEEVMEEEEDAPDGAAADGDGMEVDFDDAVLEDAMASDDDDDAAAGRTAGKSTTAGKSVGRKTVGGKGQKSVADKPKKRRASGGDDASSDSSGSGSDSSSGSDSDSSGSEDSVEYTDSSGEESDS